MQNELDLLKEQNLQLNEQVKLLIRTEKKLYRAHKQSEQYTNLIRSLNDFALSCSGEFNIVAILTKAIDLLCGIFPFDVGTAGLIDSDFSKLHGLSFEKGAEPPTKFFEVAVQSPNLVSVGCRTPVLMQAQQGQIAEYLNKLRNALPIDFSIPETMSALIPLSHNGSETSGFIAVGRRLESSITIHSKLPTEEDIPFFTLLQGHIQGALGNAISHHRQRNFARLLEDKVEQKTTELKEAQSLLMESSRKAGISEIATNILHNVGNVLNSVTTSSSQIEGHLSQMHFDSLAKCSRLLLSERNFDAKDFATLLFELHKQFTDIRALALKENRWLCENIEHIKQIVNAQQDLAKTQSILEQCSVEKLIKDAVQIVETSSRGSSLSPQIRIDGNPTFWMDRHRILQILVNLIRNATESVKSDGKPDNPPEIFVEVAKNSSCVVSVKDNGIGIHPDFIAKIFSSGFTTKPNGHGFGLHSSANAAKEIGGRLYATSKGNGCGATFILEIPYVTETCNSTNEAI